MAQFVKLDPEALRELHVGNERLVSYNVEMAEVTGGTFWKAYTPEQIAGTAPFEMKGGLNANIFAEGGLMQYYDPIDLYDEKLRTLAKEIGPSWVRVSGSWATKTYYDFDGHTGGKVPEGYGAVLNRQQWMGVLDFCKAMGAKLLISVADCEGLHHADEPWNPSQAQQIFALSKEYGKPIDAVEFVNEPNLLEMSGCPKGYTPELYAKNQDIFARWLRENYPDCLFVGTSTSEGTSNSDPAYESAGDSNSFLKNVPLEVLLKGMQEKLDVYSYHYYNGVAERLRAMMPNSYWLPDRATSEDYLDVARSMIQYHTEKRDIYCPGGEIWVTESGDAGGGGTTWASTYLDVFRTLNELGAFCTVTKGIIFHNTLASSDYGFLSHGSFDPPPQLLCRAAVAPPDGQHCLRHRRTHPGGCPRLRSFPRRRQARQGVSRHQQQPDRHHHRCPAEGRRGVSALRRDSPCRDHALQRQGSGAGRGQRSAGDGSRGGQGWGTDPARSHLHFHRAVITT